MQISHAAERALIHLAEMGLWLSVADSRLQVIATRPNTSTITDALRAQLASQKAELLEVVPLLESERIELTDAVVRVLFARLTPGEQQIAINMRDHGNRRVLNDAFYRNFDNLSQAEKVQYLWAFVYGPPANVIQLRKVSA